MDPIINLLCPICTEVFRNDDNIHCTSCGHVLHYTCMQTWFDCATSCPKCRSPNPSTHKLYLSFDESSENIVKLRTALHVSELQFKRIKEDLAAKEEEVQMLKNKQVDLSSEYANRFQKLRLETDALKKTNLTLSHEIDKLLSRSKNLKVLTEHTPVEKWHSTTLKKESETKQQERNEFEANDVKTNALGSEYKNYAIFSGFDIESNEESNSPMEEAFDGDEVDKYIFSRSSESVFSLISDCDVVNVSDDSYGEGNNSL